VSGCVGPRGDGYDPGLVMRVDEAQAYHAPQIGIYEAAGADMVAAITMTNPSEAIGIARAAADARVPVAVAFTVETDGRLPTGQPLREAIAEVDAATATGPAYYMINCAHPTHFESQLLEGGAWLQRVRGIRANASRRSHAELNEAPDLDAGDPLELGAQYGDLVRRFPHINVLGGCCGTDHRHVHAIGVACTAAKAA
jgi:S-methylmethionine-dependent homocysteine/selenocysteine methylase